MPGIFFPPQEESMDNLQAIVVEEDHQNVTRSMDNVSAGVSGCQLKRYLEDSSQDLVSG